MPRRGLGPTMPDEEEDGEERIPADAGSVGDMAASDAVDAMDAGQNEGDGDVAAAGGDEEIAAGSGNGGEGDEQPNVTAEDQKAYEDLIDRGRSLLYDKRSLPKLTQQLKADEQRSDGAPPEGLSAAVFAAMQRIHQSAQQAGVSIDAETGLQAGIALVEDLADFADDRGIVYYDAAAIEAGIMRFTDLYQGLAGASVDKDAAAETMSKLVAADQSGELASSMPGLAEHYGAAATDGEPEEETY